MAEAQASAEERVLVLVGGGIVEAICAEPAISAFAERSKGGLRVVVCSPAADLYVGHPQISGIMYRQEDAPTELFDRIIELSVGAASLRGLVQDYSRQLGVDGLATSPRVYVTSMDRLRTGRFHIGEFERPVVVIVLAEQAADLAPWDAAAADIEERLGGSAVFISAKKYPQLEHGKNLTGRLMPREMAAVLSRSDGWIGFDAEAAALGWAAERRGIVFADEPFESPEGTIIIEEAIFERERVLEALSRMFENGGTE